MVVLLGAMYNRENKSSTKQRKKLPHYCNGTTTAHIVFAHGFFHKLFASTTRSALCLARDAHIPTAWLNRDLVDLLFPFFYRFWSWRNNCRSLWASRTWMRYSTTFGFFFGRKWILSSQWPSSPVLGESCLQHRSQNTTARIVSIFNDFKNKCQQLSYILIFASQLCFGN